VIRFTRLPKAEVRLAYDMASIFLVEMEDNDTAPVSAPWHKDAMYSKAAPPLI
jgi:hypothetical protein